MRLGRSRGNTISSVVGTRPTWPWTGGADLEPLQRILARLDRDIRRERDQLVQAQERLVANAAFSVQAMENDEISAGASKLDVLASSIERLSVRVALLGRQLAFIEQTNRSLLPLIGENGVPRDSQHRAWPGHGRPAF